MAQYDDYDDDDQDDVQQSDNRNPLRAQLKRMEKEVKALREQAEAGVKATRMLEFAKAGVPLDDPRARYFVNGYDGELTADAIKAEATVLGLLQTEAPAQGTVPDAERAAHERMAAANSGQTVPGGRDFDAEIAAAKTVQDVQRLAVEKHAAQGPPGTPAVVHD